MTITAGLLAVVAFVVSAQIPGGVLPQQRSCEGWDDHAEKLDSIRSAVEATFQTIERVPPAEADYISAESEAVIEASRSGHVDHAGARLALLKRTPFYYAHQVRVSVDVLRRALGDAAGSADLLSVLNRLAVALSTSVRLHSELQDYLEADRRRSDPVQSEEQYMHLAGGAVLDIVSGLLTGHVCVSERLRAP